MGLFDFFKTKRVQSVSQSQNVTPPENATKLSKPTPKEQQSNIDSCRKEETDSAIDNAVASLRNQIIAEITRTPAVVYQLASLIGEDAKNCFPEGPFQWYGAWFMLNLQTGRLSAKVATYPDQFGASREDRFPLTATKFNRIAKQFYMKKELQTLKSDEDWSKLFDDRLKTAVASACATLHKQCEERKSEKVKEKAVRIPAEYAKQAPDMCLSEITIKISQRYSDRSIEISNKNSNYQIVYLRYSHTSQSRDRYTRMLSAAEAMWLEKQVESTIKNPDESTWQSLPGGDEMCIVIKSNKGNDVSLRNVKPIRKYSDLQTELQHLAQYGSSFV